MPIYDNAIPESFFSILKTEFIYMLKMGCTMKEISDWLGHSDIGTSMNIYGHLDLDAKKSDAKCDADFLSRAQIPLKSTKK